MPKKKPIQRTLFDSAPPFSGYGQARNTLPKLSIYLAGPITGVDPDDALNWRAAFREQYGDEFGVRIPQDTNLESREGAELWRGVREAERLDILNCNATIARLDRLSMGTAMGIMYAYMSGRTVVVVNRMKDEELSPMILAHAHLVCEEIDEAVQYIRKRHARRSLKGVRWTNGAEVVWDDGKIVQDIQDAITLMMADADARSLNPPRAEILADAAIMRVEDLLESEEVRADLLSTEDLAEIVEKLLTDNARRDEIRTLAKTYTLQRARLQARHDRDERGQDTLKFLKDFLHDVKAPTGNIKRTCEELQEELQAEAGGQVNLEEVGELVEDIFLNQEHLFNRLLEARNRAEQEYRVETVRLKDMVQPLAEGVSEVRFNIDIPDNLYAEVRTEGLRSILTILKDNSIRHGFEGKQGGTINLRARVRSDNDLVLEYWNDGLPLNRATAEFIFGQSGPGAESDGWRWGLSQVRRYIEEMGGEIHCVPVMEKKVKGGVRLVEVEEGPPLFRIVLHGVVRAVSSKRRVLVADDNPLDRKGLERTLKKGGLEVVQAATVEEALAVIQAGPLYGAVLDVDFKEGRDGIWLLKRLMEQQPGARVVVVSGSVAGGLGGPWKDRADAAGAMKTLDKDSYSRRDILECFS